jgi:hypothetical protein
MQVIGALFSALYGCGVFYPALMSGAAAKAEGVARVYWMAICSNLALLAFFGLGTQVGPRACTSLVLLTKTMVLMMSSGWPSAATWLCWPSPDLEHRCVHALLLSLIR